jgi:hypothetical protein
MNMTVELDKRNIVMNMTFELEKRNTIMNMTFELHCKSGTGTKSHLTHVV